jgi:hypothetical protein
MSAPLKWKRSTVKDSTTSNTEDAPANLDNIPAEQLAKVLAAAKAERERRLGKDPSPVTGFTRIERVIGTHSAELLAATALAEAERLKIMARARAPEGESISSFRPAIPDQGPKSISVVVGDDDERVMNTLSAFYIVHAGEVVLTDRLGRPLGGGAGSHYQRVREGDDVEHIARGLLQKLDADRNSGAGRINYRGEQSWR